ncbi:MAG TPA: response regulator [Anaerolineae bacterium]|nr:response regulator [Anaerolineae bacterium]
MNERILIIDDDPDALTLIGLTLERRGYTVLKAAGGTEALLLIESDPPDLILLDLMMPHMDGYEVCRRLKSNPRLTDIPVVMLTAKAQMASQVEGYRVGADDYVTKPVHPDELASHIQSVLERARERKSKQAGGRAVGVVGVKGGVGTTTIAVNLAVTLAASCPTILADFDPSGTAAIHLGLGAAPTSAELLTREPEAIDLGVIEQALAAHESGLRFLATTSEEFSAEQARIVLARLLELCDVCVLDLGGGLNPIPRALLSKCDLVLMAIDSDRAAVLQAQRMLLALTEMGVNRSRLRLVWANRAGLEAQSALSTIRAAVGEEPVHIIDSAVGSAYRSVESGRPLVVSDPDSPAAVALRGLAQSVLVLVSTGQK